MYVIVTVTKLVGGTIKVTVNRPHRRIPSTQECVRFCCTWVFHKRRWKFAVMWANHHWKNVYPAHSPDIVALRWGGTGHILGLPPQGFACGPSANCDFSAMVAMRKIRIGC